MFLLENIFFMPISRQPLPDQTSNNPPNGSAWFHIVLTTYGTWLPGDRRGFRTRHHRQHVEGDYKASPKESYSALHAKSAAEMKHATARVAEDYRSVLGIALIQRLHQLGGFPLTCAVMPNHVHLLVKLPAEEVQNWIALAKKHAWFEMRDAGWQEKLWAKKGKIVRIRDKPHQRNCFAYIVKHYQQGAWVWVRDCVSDSVLKRILGEKK